MIRHVWKAYVAGAICMYGTCILSADILGRDYVIESIRRIPPFPYDLPLLVMPFILAIVLLRLTGWVEEQVRR